MWSSIYIVAIIIVFLVVIYYYRTNILRPTTVIPLQIFQTWYTKDLPPYMRKCVDTLKSQNPEFKHFLYDDDECREYIAKNYDADVLSAFDQLIPGAYKADLWRYCVLYKEGGIYLDIKYRCSAGFKLIELTDDEYFVKDREWTYRGVYNAFMVCKPGNPILKLAIDRVVNNVDMRYYGVTALAPTGPYLLVNCMTPSQYKSMVLRFDEIDGFHIIYGNMQILTEYPEYRQEQRQFQKNKHYGYLWDRRQIYK